MEKAVIRRLNSFVNKKIPPRYPLINIQVFEEIVKQNMNKKRTSMHETYNFVSCFDVFLMVKTKNLT